MLFEKFILNVAAAVFGIASILLLYKEVTTLRRDYREVLNNYNAVMYENNRLHTMAREEIKRYDEKLDSIMKVVGVKPKKNVEVVTFNYHYKDTTVYSIHINDSVLCDTTENLKMNFLISKECYEVSGSLTRDSLSIDKVSVKDKLRVFVGVQDYEKKFLFIKWRPFYKAVVYSECNKDTLAVENYIRIVKHRR